VKYRHSFHAGNFADVHKHVTLLALLRALQKKDKGFLYLDTHAGRGCYDLSTPTAEAAAGVVRFLASAHGAAELRDYAGLLASFRALPGWRHCYPGSPLLAACTLRTQDRAVLVEINGAEAHALAAALALLPAGAGARARIERGDGFARLRALLPPPQRRGLTLLDSPYEESRADLTRISAALTEALRRFPTGVHVAWYPIKEEKSTAAWLQQCVRQLATPVLVSELWLYPRDARVGLNGSGLLVVNPPWQTLERMQVWLPELQKSLSSADGAGNSARLVPAAS
jgi:23S rRNA (adenine2030-N6)-methyltransferase